MFDFLKKIMGGGESVDLQEWINKGAVILDVRTPQEFQSGHPKGAINIPVQSLAGALHKLKKDKPIITCCASGNRSGSAASILKANGFQEVVNGGPWQQVAQYV